MESGENEVGTSVTNSDRRRDSLLLKLLRAPHQPHPKRERVKLTPNLIMDNRKKRPPSKGRVYDGKSRA